MLGSTERVRVQCIPVRFDDDVIAVVTREARPTLGRQLGELEHHYLALFDRFAHMIGEGTFPFRQDDDEYEDAPRVGDGVIFLDHDMRVRFASPNAVSAMHRMGIHSYATGLYLSEMGFEQDAVDIALHLRLPVTEEIERGETSVLLRVIPLLEGERDVGALMLLRDVSDLRRRDRMLLSKDATIREIHHRVKNNLQTIAALLRLQGRRLQSPEAQAAIEESERRIRSIAVVHETLSRDASDVVRFDEIVKPLVRIVEETVTGPDTDLRLAVEGDAGVLPGDLATPLAVVLNELMQNAVDHAFPRENGKMCGSLTVVLARADGEIIVDVVDDGVGLPPDFSIERSGGLGLSIVHTLVTSELGGSMELFSDHGTRVHLKIPLRKTGTASFSWVAPPRSLASQIQLFPGFATPEGYSRRCLASQTLRSLRRSSSVVPPQMPASWLVASANSMHSSRTGQAAQMRRAVSICSSAGPLLPMGKKTSGSESRQAERSRHSATSQS